jgi:hypothetical protein
MYVCKVVCVCVYVCSGIIRTRSVGNVNFIEISIPLHIILSTAPDDDVLTKYYARNVQID